MRKEGEELLGTQEERGVEANEKGGGGAGVMLPPPVLAL